MSPEETTAPSEGILNMETTLSQVEDVDHTVEEPTEVSITVDGQYTTQSDNQDCQVERNKENRPRSTELKTKLAKEFERCFGPSTYIDNLWYKIKHDNKTSKMLKSKHRELILSLKNYLHTSKNLNENQNP